MTDPAEVGKVLVTLFGAGAASRGLAKLLGPATGEVAEALRRWTAHRVGNVERVVNNASAKIQDPDQPGQVPPRVAMRILEEGSYSDDDFVVEYLGGVLASSRTPLGRDDRGNTFAALVSRMSTYEIRTHYVFYTIARQLLVGRDINFQLEAETQRYRLYVPYTVYVPAMDFAPNEEEWFPLLSHALYWLSKDALLRMETAGSVETVRRLADAPHVEEPGFIAHLTVPGIALYLWAHGQGGHPIRRFLDPDQTWEFQAEITIPDGSEIVSEMKPAASEAPRGQE